MFTLCEAQSDKDICSILGQVDDQRRCRYFTVRGDGGDILPRPTILKSVPCSPSKENTTSQKEHLLQKESGVQPCFLNSM